MTKKNFNTLEKILTAKISKKKKKLYKVLEGVLTAKREV